MDMYVKKRNSIAWPASRFALTTIAIGDAMLVDMMVSLHRITTLTPAAVMDRKRERYLDILSWNKYFEHPV